MSPALSLRARVARPTARFVLLALMVLALMLVGSGCRTKSTPPPEPALISVTDERADLHYTWIDAKGNFHTETLAKDVPLEGRDYVRVLDPAADSTATGAGDSVQIADLRNKLPTGNYSVHRVTRAEFEATATQRRAQAGVALLGVAPTTSAGGPASTLGPVAAGNGEAADAPQNRPKVIIYGASWCHACHDAARYLTKRNIPFVEKDIEQDPAAAREMNAKLRAAGRRGGSIPVLDVRGTILIGFAAEEVEQALGKPS
jgi:glutaredoxin